LRHVKNEPVLSGLYNLIRGKYKDPAVQLLWDSRFSTDGRDLLSLSDRIPEGKLSRFEKRPMRHLNVIITEADEELCYMIVPITTCREKDGKPFGGQDGSCILPDGCHPFIKHKSYVRMQKPAR
jgi:hypothetical protein